MTRRVARRGLMRWSMRTRGSGDARASGKPSRPKMPKMPPDALSLNSRNWPALRRPRACPRIPPDAQLRLRVLSFCRETANSKASLEIPAVMAPRRAATARRSSASARTFVCRPAPRRRVGAAARNARGHRAKPRWGADGHRRLACAARSRLLLLGRPQAQTLQGG
eukprot:356047-Chlamydomonas_euryale.AAC.3